MSKIKKWDIIIVAAIFLLGIGLLIGFRLYEEAASSGNVYAKISYDNELILMIDLETLEYHIYDTDYKDQIVVDRYNEGIFYVPGKVTTDMDVLYEIDDYARENQIVGIKLLVEDQKISVVYQESPRDLCQFQAPTDSHLRPIVCLPNALVIDVYTDLTSDQFVPDSVLE